MLTLTLIRIKIWALTNVHQNISEELANTGSKSDWTLLASWTFKRHSRVWSASYNFWLAPPAELEEPPGPELKKNWKENEDVWTITRSMLSTPNSSKMTVRAAKFSMYELWYWTEAAAAAVQTVTVFIKLKWEVLKVRKVFIIYFYCKHFKFDFGLRFKILCLIIVWRPKVANIEYLNNAF